HTFSAGSMKTPISSRSSWPAIAVPCAVEPTTPRRISLPRAMLRALTVPPLLPERQITCARAKHLSTKHDAGSPTPHYRVSPLPRRGVLRTHRGRAHPIVFSAPDGARGCARVRPLRGLDAASPAIEGRIAVQHLANAPGIDGDLDAATFELEKHGRAAV